MLLQVFLIHTKPKLHILQDILKRKRTYLVRFPLTAETFTISQMFPSQVVIFLKVNRSQIMWILRIQSQVHYAKCGLEIYFILFCFFPSSNCLFVVLGYESRNRGSREGNSRRLNSKKPASETTDSGVSVISDSVPCLGKHSTEWLIMRMKETCDRTNSKHRYIKQLCMSSLGAHK